MRISSDTWAKTNAFAVVLILLVGGAVAAVGVFMLTNNRTNEQYEVTIEITAMEIASDSGSVYNVVHKTTEGNRYYNPESGKFDSTSPSGKADLYVSVTMGDKEKFTEKHMRNVQTAKEPAVEETVSEKITFRVTTSSDSEIVAIFLMIGGSSGSDYDSVADIYADNAGQHGINLSVELKDGVEEKTLTGNADSDVRGLVKLTITTKVI